MTLRLKSLRYEDPQLAAEGADVFDDVPRARLPQRELVLGRRGRLHHPHQRVDRERVMLRRHSEQASRWRPVEVALLEERDLLDDLPGVAEELHTIGGECHAARGAEEEHTAHPALEVFHRRRHRGLRDVEQVGGGADRSLRGDLDVIGELLQGDAARTLGHSLRLCHGIVTAHFSIGRLGTAPWSHPLSRGRARPISSPIGNLMAHDFTFRITTTRFDEDYSPSENSRITTNFANLARGEHRQQNLRNALSMIDRRFNDLAEWDNPHGDRYTVELEIVSVAVQFAAEGEDQDFPLLEVLDIQIVDRLTGKRSHGIVGNNFSSYIRDYDFSVRLPAATAAAGGFTIPSDFGDLHGKLFQHFLDSAAYRERFAVSPVICISVSTSKTYRRTENHHSILGVEYEQKDPSLTDAYFGKMGLSVRYFMPRGSVAPLAFYFRGDLLDRLHEPPAHRHDQHDGDVPEDLSTGDLQRELGRGEDLSAEPGAAGLLGDEDRLRPRRAQPARGRAGEVHGGAPHEAAR